MGDLAGKVRSSVTSSTAKSTPSTSESQTPARPILEPLANKKTSNIQACYKRSIQADENISGTKHKPLDFDVWCHKKAPSREPKDKEVSIVS